MYPYICKEQFHFLMAFDDLLTRDKHTQLVEMILKNSQPLLDIDQPPTKSIEKVSQGLLYTGNGMYNPSFLLFDLLVQRAQSLIILETCSYILGQ